MKRFLCLWLAVGALMAVRAPGADADHPTCTVQVPGADKLEISLPPGWKYAIDRPPAGVPPTVDITSPGGALLKITFMQDPKGQFTKSDELDKLVTKANRQYVANSVEKRVVLQRLAANAGPGVYAVFTDPKLAGTTKTTPGDFRYVSSGARSFGRQVVIFSLLSNTKDHDEYRQALDVLANGVAVAGAGH